MYSYLFDNYEEILCKHEITDAEYSAFHWTNQWYAALNNAWLLDAVTFAIYIYTDAEFVQKVHPSHYAKILVDGVPYSPPAPPEP